MMRKEMKIYLKVEMRKRRDEKMISKEFWQILPALPLNMISFTISDTFLFFPEFQTLFKSSGR